MACGISFEATATSTVLFLLVLLQAALVWDEVHGAPAKRNDILAGTEFLSVFINGAMATPPQRRKGFRRGGNGAAIADSATAESHQHEASIYRISRNPGNRQVIPRARNTGGREEVVRFYPISHKTLENRQQNLASLIDELSSSSGASSTRLAPQGSNVTTVSTTRDKSSLPAKSNATNSSTNKGVSRQKVIGVSVTSTVEATPYKVRVEHYDNADSTRQPSPTGISSKDVTRELRNATTRTPTVKSLNMTAKTTPTTTTPKSSTTASSSPSSFVTEELSNIVSESNRSEFSVDEGSPSTSWRDQSSITPGPVTQHTTAFVEHQKETNSSDVPEDMITLPTEENYELPEENSEPKEFSEEPVEMHSERFQTQGRKASRHYDTSNYNRPGAKVYSQPRNYKSSRPYSEPAKLYSEPAKVYSEPEKVYGEPAKMYSEPAKVYSEPAKVYSEPAKVYSEPAKVYGEPERVYSEPSKVYSEPAKVYSEPAKVYSQPSKVYSEPSKLYDPEGQPLNQASRGGEPDEQNYEVDESVSVSSNGNVHGPQIMLTEPSNASEVEDGHKVGYVVEGRNFRKYRVEERTPDGFIVGEYGVVSHDDGSLRGVRYTADGTINPRLIYDALMKFLSLKK
ncbi:mucin-12-like [Ceratina calcarata]|uniref:Mucin-12-like n=1 Tax=Ceratina calcarata TaxID=156304 RepID=A0AAJ7J113_9HYME|nr:mucin-12-like [Ceratina calcarata]